jgi:hypothetical protein
MAGLLDYLRFLRPKKRTVNKKKTKSSNTQRKPVAAFRKVYRDVYYGERKKTKGGLTKSGLVKLNDGRIVSKKRHAHGMRLYESQSNSNTNNFAAKWDMHKGVLPKDKKKMRRSRWF